jgi:predicted enzyme related to lactoylglutathione lyase
MQKVLGFGGFFFKSPDPEALARWYEDNLGVTRATPANGYEPWQQEPGPTAFTPFPNDTKMFPNTAFMLNFRVSDLDAMVSQLQAAGIVVEVDPENYPYGRFASLSDPDGTPIQLWQPDGD